MLVSYQNLQVGISFENLDECPVLLRMESLEKPESPYGRRATFLGGGCLRCGLATKLTAIDCVTLSDYW
ncbi:hypothetical protein RW1_035_00810 [Rhodococcus wratislaviensis NBRC 100605]|uniref:Uncharacterized protein n=1 Tax=Rhodococcus wratislaviensis NBRC 100605 TaxID=1219028 RepID=X0Q7Y2_RHOWR|nr:hypothetical protein RW1_035_00810 [Rhodococcus wratislaviensis NBRC 100605]